MLQRTSSSVAINVGRDHEAEMQMSTAITRRHHPMAEGPSLRVTRRASSSIAVRMDSNGDISVGPDDESFKGLVKDRRFGCFRRLGGSDGIAAKLASSMKGGIRGDGPDLQRRRELFGVNTYNKTKSLCSHFRDTVRDVFLLVLLVFAALSLGFGIKEHGMKEGWYDGVGIFVSFFLIAVMSAVGNHCHGKLFDQLCRDYNPVTVIRGGKDQNVLTSDVVVGDVLFLKTGDIVPADGVVFQEFDMEVKRSIKDRPVHLDQRHEPFCPAGAKVTKGHGCIVVTAVGQDTDCGQQMSRSITIRNTVATPLQMRLDGLKSKISDVRNALAMLTTLYSSGETSDVTTKVVGVFQHTLAIVVSAIPEALPLAVSLTLAFCTKRILEERALVQRFSDCEALGSVTAVCIGIRGLLAPDQMTVTKFWVDTNPVEEAASIARGIVDLLCQGISSTNTSANGNTIEQSALWSWAVTALGMDSDKMRMTYKVLHVFDVDRKRCGALTADSTRDVVLAHWIGAAGEVLARCCRYVSADGNEHDLGVDKRREFEKIISNMVEANLCSFALAFKEAKSDISETMMDLRLRLQDAESDLTLLCLVSLKEPCCQEVKDAIEACATAGISVKMVTSCITATAQAVAKECGIISRDDTDDVVIEGQEFRDMSMDRQLEIVDRIRVMSRSLPTDRLLLMQRLNNRGHVVAGITNDRAIESSIDIWPGFEDLSSNEVFQPDAIIINNKLDTVVRAAGWSRCVYSNIQKFIQFQLTFNIAAVVVNLVLAVTKGKVLLTSLQLVWVSLIIDTMGALALATDTPPLKELMRRPPVSRTAPLISNAMWRDTTAQAVFQVAVLLAIAYGGHHAFGTGENAMIFNAFVLCQVCNEFNARQMEQKNIFAGLHRNWMFLAIVAVTLALHVLMVEMLAKFVGTQRLSWAQWGVCGVIAIMSWPIAWVVKFIPVPDKPFHEILPKFTFRFFSRFVSVLLFPSSMAPLLG
ncbi:hypothetical protein EJB05_33614, partial [Eragrostis curvula]